MTKEKLIQILATALQAEGAVEVYPDPDDTPEKAGIRLVGNASLARIADSILQEREQQNPGADRCRSRRNQPCELRAVISNTSSRILQRSRGRTRSRFEATSAPPSR